jgi:hypothetical protein
VRTPLAIGLVVIGLVLSACSFPGGTDIKQACQSLKDHAGAVPGVTAATYGVGTPGGEMVCSGTVQLAASLTAEERGAAVGGVYDIVRSFGGPDLVSTDFMTGETDLLVVNGFPIASDVAWVYGVIDRTHANHSRMYGAGSLYVDLMGTVTTSSPAESLRAGIDLLTLTRPEGIRWVNWYIGENTVRPGYVTAINSEDISPDMANQLRNVASWLDKHPDFTTFRLTMHGAYHEWLVTTTRAVPDDVRAFAQADAGPPNAIKVSARLVTSNAPYLTVP